MAKHFLENDSIKLSVNESGAELSSIVSKSNNTEYLWCGDSNFWNRRSPILFPFVGGLKNKEYSFEGKTYPMGQHGFARDMVFVPSSITEDSIWMRLVSNETTRTLYPFDFILEVGYVLKDNFLQVIWKVYNKSDKKMHFSIGGHPAFMCPIYSTEKQTDYFIDFHTDNNLLYNLVGNDGLVSTYDQELVLDRGILSISSDLFDHDALIIENQQVQKISLLDTNKNPYVTVSFDAPLVGVWSPTNKNAPFICIEPWYGRCDSTDFDGTLEQRLYNNKLNVGEVFEASYTIEFNM